MSDDLVIEARRLMRNADSYELCADARELIEALCREVERLRGKVREREVSARERERIAAGDRRDWETLDRMDREDEERGGE